MNFLSLDDKIKYIGYKDANLDRFGIRLLKPLSEELKKYNNIGLNPMVKEMDKLPNISLSEVKSLAQKFYKKYFSLHNVNILNIQKISNKKYDCITASKTSEEFYDKLNKELKSVSPFHMDIKLMDGHSMIGYAKKEFIMPQYNIQKPNRKVYFSNLGLGDMLTELSGATLVHEIAHTQLEHNIGYAEDYLHSEVINIFLEKLAALEIDKTGKLLEIQEKYRFRYLAQLYNKICKSGSIITREDKIANLVYIKAILIANKMFDMYQSDKKDKYIYDIQDIFNGNSTVEDFIKSKDVTIEKCVETQLFKNK